MPSVAESAASASPLAAALAAGVDWLSQQQEVDFTLYARVVLPVDGFVFWVRADLVSPSALPNVMAANSAEPNASRHARAGFPPKTLRAKGSIHYSIDTEMGEDGTYGHNRVIFTSETQVNDLDAIAPEFMYIGDFRGVRFGFSAQKYFYVQAGLWHYFGDAIYPAMRTQVVDDPRAFDRSQVVSNSLPAWLSFARAAPSFWLPPRTPFPLFPSFAVPDNLSPPYGTVHVDPGATRGLQASPSIDRRSTHSQLAFDRVRITTYGVRNEGVMDFVDAVNSWSTDYGVVGIMNVPIPRDEKRLQNEMSVLAIKKTIEYEVSYYQTRMNDVARQLIESALVAFSVSDRIP